MRKFKTEQQAEDYLIEEDLELRENEYILAKYAQMAVVEKTIAQVEDALTKLYKVKYDTLKHCYIDFLNQENVALNKKQLENEMDKFYEFKRDMILDGGHEDMSFEDTFLMN